MKKILLIFIVVIVLGISITSISAQAQYEIPSWVKGVAGFWAEGKITDADFGEGLTFLIDSEIIKIPKIQELQNKVSQLQTENTHLRSQLNLPIPDNNTVPKDCASNQIWQNNECQDVVTPPKNNLKLMTNKSTYMQGDIIVIKGWIDNYTIGPGDVSVIVRAPDNNIVTMTQVHPNTDGSFQTNVKADGPQFMAPGEYKVFANFSGLKSEIKFKFTGGNGGITSDPDDTTTCPTGQTLVNGKCSSITPASDGVITVNFEKNSYNSDEKFIFVGKESNGNTSVFVIIRDSVGNFMGMLSDPSSDSDGTYSTLPRDVSQFFKSKGTYVATAFTDNQKEENGISIIIQYDGFKITR